MHHAALPPCRAARVHDLGEIIADIDVGNVSGMVSIASL